MFCNQLSLQLHRRDVIIGSLGSVAVITLSVDTRYLFIDVLAASSDDRSIENMFEALSSFNGF